MIPKVLKEQQGILIGVIYTEYEHELFAKLKMLGLKEISNPTFGLFECFTLDVNFIRSGKNSVNPKRRDYIMPSKVGMNDKDINNKITKYLQAVFNAIKTTTHQKDAKG